MPGTTFTLDLEDHHPDDPASVDRVVRSTHRLLDDLDGIGVRGTVFVVGRLAQDQPDLVREVVRRGHEVALHDWDHTQLDRTDAARLRADAATGKALLEDLAQQPVAGYRAATFSLTPATVWATDVLAEVGFSYSSSVVPARNPLHGFPGAATGPFLWPSGLLEIPVPLLHLGVAQVPLGGTYLRALPLAVVRKALAEHPVPSLYCHPYDFDPDEPFFWEPEAGRLSPLLWVGRKGMAAKVAALLRDPAPPLGERLDEARTAIAAAERPASISTAVVGDQSEMIHRLPKARLVPRIDHLASLARGHRVIHVGFVDAGYEQMQAEAGTWLHEHLASTAEHLVGIDLDEGGVARARARGYEAYAVDCRDSAAVAAAGIEPAEVVIAGEVIEHLDEPGPFLDGMHGLVEAGGRLVVTTPNASGLLNTVAALAGREVNHPDHVVMFTARTLQALLERHGWEVEEVATYVAVIKEGARRSAGLLALGGRVVLGAERMAGRLGAPYLAEGLIMTARSTR